MNQESNSQSQNQSLPDSSHRDRAVSPPRDPDEINLLEYLYALIHRKWLIIGMSVLGFIGGHIAARIKGPSFKAEAIIAPRESESTKTPTVSGFGGLGGLVASQLNLGGNASLDKIDVVLDTRRFFAGLIEEHNLVPQIYRYDNPDVYTKYYNEESQSWDEEFEQPDPLKMTGAVSSLLESETENNTMTLTVETTDSLYSHTMLSTLLDYLNEYLMTMVQHEAAENEAYLEQRLITVADPLLREKIQTLIANEVEKQMLVSKEAFSVLDPPFTARTFREKKLYPLVFGFGLFFVTTLLVVFGHALTSADKTEEDKRLIEGIKRELWMGRR